MKRVSNSLVLSGVLVAIMCPTAKAQLIYSNGPIIPTGPPEIGRPQCWLINNGNLVSDSFTVTSAANLTTATAGIWNDQGATQVALRWSIGTAPGLSDVSSGVSNTTDSFQFFNGYDVYEDSFAINGLVTPGSYWLTLQDYSTSDNGLSGWDINDGPSVAYQYGYWNGPVADGPFPGSNSSSFQIYGDVTPVTGTPEPGAIAMAMGLGLSGWTVLRRRRKRA